MSTHRVPALIKNIIIITIVILIRQRLMNIIIEISFLTSVLTRTQIIFVLNRIILIGIWIILILIIFER